MTCSGRNHRPGGDGRLADEETEQTNETGSTDSGPASEEEQAPQEKRVAELTNDLKRLQADFDNFKKRTEKDWAERSKIANQRLMSDLLPILDSFDKALDDTAKNGNVESLRQGLRGLHKQLLQVVQREGLKEIDTKGNFDPFMHEALMREEREDAEDGKILEVYQKGYAIGNRAIRPAKVKVAKKKDLEEPLSEEVTDTQDNQTSKAEEDTERGDDEDDSVKG